MLFKVISLGIKTGSVQIFILKKNNNKYVVRYIYVEGQY